MATDDPISRPGRLTRRHLFQAGAATTAAVAAAQVGLPGSAEARPSGFEPGLLTDEVRFFAGDYVPRGWREAPLAGRALLGAGAVPGGPTRKVGDRGPGSSRSAADGGPASLGLTCIEIDDLGEADGVFIGEVRAFAFGVVPDGWYPCDGRMLRVESWNDPDILIVNVIRDRFGGDGRRTFALPDLRDRTPLAAGESNWLPAVALGQERDDLAPAGDGRATRLHLNYCICNAGPYPPRA